MLCPDIKEMKMPTVIEKAKDNEFSDSNDQNLFSEAELNTNEGSQSEHSGMNK